MGRHGESEWALAQTLLDQVPAGALLLAHRLYGCPAFVAPLQAVCDRVGSHFLIRAQSVVKGRVVRELRDGSRLLELSLRRPQRPTPEITSLTVREIAHGSVGLVIVPPRSGCGRACWIRRRRPHSISRSCMFAKMLRVVERMWFTLDAAAPVLTEEQTAYVLTRMYERMRRYVTPRRRARSCPRAVRQPVTGWPRLMKAESIEGPFEFTIV